MTSGARIAGGRPGGACAEAILENIKARIARMRTDRNTVARAQLVALSRSIETLGQLLEDRNAEIAYLRSRNQPTIADSVLGRLLEGDVPQRGR